MHLNTPHQFRHPCCAAFADVPNEYNSGIWITDYKDAVVADRDKIYYILDPIICAAHEALWEHDRIV